MPFIYSFVNEHQQQQELNFTVGETRIQIRRQNFEKLSAQI